MNGKKGKKLISVIVPVYNEQQTMKRFYAEISKVANALPYSFEFIFIDDGSNDPTFSILSGLRRKDARVKILRLSRNFGSHVAITAGLDFASGNAAVIMASDLQDPPALIPKFLEKWSAGSDVVWGARSEREDALGKRLAADIYYWLVRKLALPNYPKGGTGSFCLIDRKVIDSFRQMRERSRLTFAIISWLGYSQAQVAYRRGKRIAGKSKWKFRNLVKLIIDVFTLFSYFPIRLISSIGLCIAALSFIYGIAVLFNYFMYGVEVAGWTSVMVATFFLGGIQLIMLGIVGEYVWRIFHEVKHRPIYVLQEKIGFKKG